MSSTEKQKRGSGSNKSRRKKREYRDHIRAQIRAGLENLASGAWIQGIGRVKGKAK